MGYGNECFRESKANNRTNYSHKKEHSHLTFTFSKSTIETLEKGMS